MPLYDYQCVNCNHVFELRQSFNSLPEADCPTCASKARRKFHAVPIIYKGSGFYTTDYKHTNYNAQSKKEEPSKSESSDNSEASSPQKKSESEASSPQKKSEGEVVSSNASANDS